MVNGRSLSILGIYTFDKVLSKPLLLKKFEIRYLIFYTFYVLIIISLLLSQDLIITDLLGPSIWGPDTVRSFMFKSFILFNLIIIGYSKQLVMQWLIHSLWIFVILLFVIRHLIRTK